MLALYLSLNCNGGLNQLTVEIILVQNSRHANRLVNYYYYYYCKPLDSADEELVTNAINRT